MGRLRPLRIGQRKGLSPAETWGSEECDAIIDERDDGREVWSRPLRRHVLWGSAPKTTADCPEGPCPWVRCRYHTALEVEFDGSLVVYQPGPWPLAGLSDSVATEIERGSYETCALRAAARGPMEPEQLGPALGIDPKRVRQIEADAIAKLSAVLPDDVLAEMIAAMDDARPQWPEWGE